MTYFTLAIRYENGKWGPEFGSYIRKEVTEAGRTCVDDGTLRKDLRIVISEDHQESIDEEFAILNKESNNA